MNFPTAVLIPTWKRAKSLIRLFKRAPVLNHPSTYVGIDKDGIKEYAVWVQEYGNQCTVIPISNPTHYPSNAHQALKEAVPLGQYDRVMFLDDNTTLTSEALYCLEYAHSLFPTSIMTGTNGIGEMFHRDAIASGKEYPVVPLKIQNVIGLQAVTIFNQMNMTFWTAPAAPYLKEFTYWPGNYAWDIELVLWLILEGHVDRLLGCREAKFSKHKHEFQETGHGSADKLRKLGESMSILAKRYPEVAEPTWLGYRVPLNKILKHVNAQKEIQNDPQK